MPEYRVDAAEIKLAMRAILQPGQVTELRALDAVTSKDRSPHTYSGYFDDIDKLVEEASRIRAAKGVYFIPNPLCPALLGRSVNKARKVVKDPTTADHDIDRRWWMLLDADPTRPSGISASDEEHQAALERIIVVRDYLIDAGWPEPIHGDSGNGGHLMLRVDLPTKDDGVIERCLKHFAEMFSDDRVTIDTSVFNPARLWKLYGTLAGKGDAAAAAIGRPQRLARLLHVPETLSIATAAQICEFAGISETGRAQPSMSPGMPTAFDIDRWIQASGLNVIGPSPWNGGRKWVLAVCPWNPDHTNHSAFVIQFATGALSAGCHHNGCQGKGWRELRNVVEPEWQERRTTQSRPGITETPNIGDIGDACGGWGPIEPFSSEPPPFPVAALPSVLQTWTVAEALALQVPSDLPAMLALATCAAAAAKTFEVHAYDGWDEPLNIYTVVALEPANRKTTCFRDATQPLTDWERHRCTDMAEAIQQYQQQRRILESRIKKLEEKAAKADDSTQREEAFRDAADASRELACLTPVVAPRRTVDDVTNERLVSMLAEQGGRLACMSPEGGIFDLMRGRYSGNGAPNFEVFLKAHAGDDIRVDRVSRPGEYVSHPALTMALAVQPEVIRGLAREPSFRGRGLIARFLWSIPLSTLGAREIHPPTVPARAAEAYHQVVQQLCSLPLRCGDDGRPPKLFLANEAASALDDFRRQIEPELALGGDLHVMQDWAGKLPGAVLRLAGIMHLVERLRDFDVQASLIDETTLLHAIEIAKYLIPHAHLALSMMHDVRRTSDAEHVLAWITRHRRTEFTERDIYQATKNRFSTVEELRPALVALIEHHVIRSRPAAPPVKPGRPSSPGFEVNPALFQPQSAPTHPQYPHNSAATDDLGSSGDIGDGSRRAEGMA